MRITNAKLKKIIEEEVIDALQTKGSSGGKKHSNAGKKWTRIKRHHGDESDTERKRRIFQGYEDIDKLSKGIIPEAEEEIEEGNENFDADGRFTTPSKATCKSTYFQNGKRKSVNKTLSDKDDTGRGKHKHKGKGRIRCKDNEPLYESKWRDFKEEVDSKEKYDSPHDEPVVAPKDTYECAKKLQHQKVLIRKLKNAAKQAKESGSKTCPLSYEDAVKIINQLEKASKGKAYEK